MRDIAPIGMLAILVSCGAQTAISQERPANPPAVPAAKVLGNDGTPMLVPFQCTEEDKAWAGLSCSDEEPCAIFLELSGVETFANRLLLTGNIHSEAATLYAVFLTSDDNGHTWREAYERIRGAGFEHFETFGADHAWLSGQELFPLTQNPFLLTTTDGGKTWHRQSILSEDDDNRVGAIQQFAFTSKDNGTLILDRRAGGGEDRYALYETADGGQSWSLKQESRRPIVTKRATAAAADWRVRADAASKSFLVEHRSGTRWSAVAAFLVKLDPCKASQ